MAWQVIQFFDNNPDSDIGDAIEHFAEELQIDQQIEALVSEADSILLLRDQLRPLYGKKADIEHNLVLLNSEFDMEIMMEFPPGKKGNADQRKNKKIDLQTNSNSYQSKIKELRDLKADIEALETKVYETETKAKNARKIVDTFNHYVTYLLACIDDHRRSKVKVTNNGIF